MGIAATPLVLALLSVVGAAAAAPTPASPAKVANATEQLEALVSDMASRQNDAVAAPTPKKVEEDLVVMEEGAERRRLGACGCNGGYRNGAGSGGPVCSKKEGSKSVCYPAMGNGQCSDNTMTKCGKSSGPSASPAPSAGRMLLDAESP